MIKIAPKKIIDKIIDDNYCNLLNSQENVVYIASIPECIEHPHLDRFYLEMGVWEKDKEITRTHTVDITMYLSNQIPYILGSIKSIIPKKRFDKIEANPSILNHDVQYVKKFKLQSKKITEHIIRPAAGGCQISSWRSQRSGTFGALLKLNIKNKARKNKDISKNDDWYIITNHHVLFKNGYEKDLSIFQPSTFSRERSETFNSDGTYSYTLDKKYQDEDNRIGTTSFSQFNSFVDVAFIKVDSNYKNKVTGGNIWNDDKIIDVGCPKIGEKVTIYGKSSFEKKGIIRSDNAYVIFDPKNKNKKIYKKQILTTSMSIDGDSGSILISEDYMAKGLLIGGDDASYTIFNNFEYIFGANTFYHPDEENIQLSLKHFINF